VKGRLRFAGVRKVYRWRGTRVRNESVKGAVLGSWWSRRRPTAEEHVALDGIDLDIERGEAVALIGPNGSGKSTLLKLAGGILQPTEGTVDVDGRVTALIELGAGFHPEITGRENVLFNGMLLGLDRREIEARLPEILDFAEIGDFIDQPVKTYSSGMYVRLGFAVAVAVEPDVLLIDEVLSVGDEAFTRRCLDRLARMRQAGVTMVLVSHDLDLVETFADRAVYLKEGRVRSRGTVDSVIARYRGDVAGAPDTPAETPISSSKDDGRSRRWGSNEVEIVSVELATGVGVTRLVPTGTSCRLQIRYRAQRSVDDFVVGVAWHRPDGTLVTGHNTDLDGHVPRALAGEGEIRCSYDALDLAPGDYLVDVAVHAKDGRAYDYWCDAIRIRVTSNVEWPGVWTPSHHWEWDDELFE
jgi:lipopolysaccharide transport system ATP-binding protein